MRRRDFLKAGIASPMFTVFNTGRRSPGLSVKPLTEHGVVIVYGSVRKKDVVDNPMLAPHHARIATQGTLFVDDFNDTVDMHGYMSSELLTGRDGSTEQPLFPTWTEYVRRETRLAASKFWMLQPVTTYRNWTWDRKHYSAHPDFGIRYGATSITTSALDAPLEEGLGHTKLELEQISGFMAAMRDQYRRLPPTAVRQHDIVCLKAAREILLTFRPRIITVQLLGFDEAHHSYRGYLRHISAIDEQLGSLWDQIQADASLRDTTAIFVRPECGRNAELSPGDRLDHTHGDYDAHYVWSLAVGPEFRRGAVVTDRVNRRDWAPTITYALSGGSAEYSSGSVRTQLFSDYRRLLPYRVSPVARIVDPKIDLEATGLDGATARSKSDVERRSLRDTDRGA